MSEKNAQQWLQEHPHIIPALACNHDEILRILNNEQQHQDIVKSVIYDPGLCLDLLIKVNSKRQSNSSKGTVESPASAISLLGDEVSHNLFKDHSVAENTLKDPDQLFLFYQLTNRSLHNVTQAEQWATQRGFQNMDLIRISALLAFAGELLCCIYDFKKYRVYIQEKSNESCCLDLFGFSFSDLTESLVKKCNLPRLILHSQTHKMSTGQPETLLKFTARLCHQCEYGWYQSQMTQVFEQFSEWLQLPQDKVINDTQAVAIKAARHTSVKQAWQPASRLILIKDSVWSELRAAPLKPQAPVPSVAPPETQKVREPQNKSPNASVNQSAQDVFAQLKHLIKQPACSQSDVLGTCFKSLIHDIGMSRASLMALSKNRESLHNRMNIGVTKDSPFRQFTIDVANSGLLKILLSKPQAIWINKDNLTKYQRHIPEQLTACTSSNYFLAMSLFIDEKPFAIIYSDRAQEKPEINNEDFIEFKKLIAYASKALTLLSKR